MIKVETDSLDVLLRTQPKLMVMFGTDWCGYCDVLKPEFERVSNEHKEIPFVYINPDNAPKSRKLVDLTDIPMLVAYKNGKSIAYEFGNTKEIVTKVLSKLLV